MSLSITIDLSDQDLEYFQEALRRAQNSAGSKTATEITEAAGKLLEVAATAQVPDFIAQRLGKLESLINMVHDEGWAMSEDDKRRVLTALAYFAEPEDVIPDSVPVVGYLDDAIMIELCVRELKHEVEAYDDFVSFRTNEAAGRGMDAATLGRADWLEERRTELQDRMRRRRSSYGMGGSSGGAIFRIA
jgi:uncharacterized membrane protein YkvA (DUF1232 family)